MGDPARRQAAGSPAPAHGHVWHLASPSKGAVEVAEVYRLKAGAFKGACRRDVVPGGLVDTAPENGAHEAAVNLPELDENSLLQEPYSGTIKEDPQFQCCIQSIFGVIAYVAHCELLAVCIYLFL